MTLLARVSALLASQGMPFALIGAAAMAAHGVGRSTLDRGLLVHDPRVLSETFWADLSGADADVRRGDDDDPLVGVVRLRQRGERDVDVIVSGRPWMRDVVARARVVALAEGPLPVATAADLVLLKLYAGGPQDRWDIEQLVAADSTGALIGVVASRLPDLPGSATVLWESIRHDRGTRN